MDLNRLKKHIATYRRFTTEEADVYAKEFHERLERKAYYSGWTADRLRRMTAEEFYEFLSKLWAMLIWGNKKYVADKMIGDNGLEQLRDGLARLLWGTEPVADRWDWFRSHIKGMGPAMISELLCHVHPDECMLWNRRAYVALNYLEVDGLPRYDYQMTGKRYAVLSDRTKQIANELTAAGFKDTDLLAVDYFIWRELQVQERLSDIGKKTVVVPGEQPPGAQKIDAFLHNDVRDKLAEIGEWLGFKTQIEVSIAPGSKVDAIWEATIGNMGRVIYVFEVQTKGSIDSLIINLLKSLKNAAVQGLVAVSDKDQIEKTRAHSADVPGLADKLRYWEYTNVLDVHESLSTVNESINRLGLVPSGF